jgi:hypothetical protein
MEEARLAAASESLRQMQATSAADPKVYEETDPRLVMRSGDTFLYEFSFLAYEDYEGGIWPGHERFEVTVKWNQRARDKASTCVVSRTALVATTY